MKIGLLVFAPFVSLSATSLKKYCEPRVCQPATACIEIRQADLPYLIAQPGEYCVNSNLTYAGTGAAIVISNVSNVKLRFNTASLTLTHADATGIIIENSEEILVESDAIENIALNSTGYGIFVDQSKVITLNNLLLRNHFQGVRITGSRTVTMNDCSVEEAHNAGAFVELSRTIIFNRVVFSANAIGLHFSGTPATATTPTTGCEVNECSFFNSTGTAELYAQQITGLTIRGCTFDTSQVTTDSIQDLLKLLKDLIYFDF